MSDDRLFLQDPNYYQRDINPLGHYIEQTALYISRMTGDDLETCKRWVGEKLQAKELPGMIDPKVEYYERNDEGDKTKESTTLSKYIYSAIANDLIVAPTFTCYTSPKKARSMLAGFVDGNVKRRGVAKKEAFVAKTAGNSVRFIMKNNEQNNMKLYNNSLSGAFGTKGSVLYNPTAHSTLTSTIRSVSSYGNASNERIIMGNRHYYHVDIVLYNLISCSQLTDVAEMRNAIVLYGLHIPSVADVIDCISYSSQFYWRDPKALQSLVSYVDKMTDIERASFVYTGDLYHIRKHNPEFMRGWIDEISRKCTEEIPDALSIVETIDEQIMNYTHQICFNEVKGLGKKYALMAEKGVLNTVVATALNITAVLRKYQPFIRTFFLSRLIPASHAYIPNMMRRSVVLSDTDSTCFSVDDWMLWYFGGVEITERTYAVCGAVAFMANQSIAHALAILSANINVVREKLHALAMKNEFLWSAHMPTNVAKHYAAWTVMQEGNVFEEAEIEIKGVHLKNSASPPALIKKAHLMIEDILTTINSNQQLDLAHYVAEVQAIERDIIESISRGETRYLKTSKIKDAEAYALEAEESPYQHYTMWREVMEPKYGVIDPPPYSVVKVPTTLGNRTKLKAWVESIEDVELRGRLARWIERMGKTSLNTLYMSIPYVNSFGMPTEILRAADSRKVVLDLTLVFRIILESLGFFVKDGWLILDYK